MGNTFKGKMRYVSAGAFTALGILLFVSFIGYLNLRESRDSGNLVEHTLLAISKLQKIQAEIFAIAGIQRAYVITRDEEYREEFNERTGPVLSLINEFSQFTSDNPTQQKNSGSLQVLSEELFRFFNEIFTLVSEDRRPEAIDLIKRRVGQNQIEKISSLLEKMILQEEKLLTERLKRSDLAEAQANNLILSGTIFAFLVLLGAFLIIRSEWRKRSETERQLNLTSQLQKAILESAAFALIATTKEGKINLFNPAAEWLTGYEASEVLGTDPSMFHTPVELAEMASWLSDRFGEKVSPGFEALSLRAKKGVIESDHWTLVRKNGSVIPIKLTMTPLKEEGEITGYLGIAYDISRQLEYEDAIVHAKEEAEAGTKAKSDFLANMSHEIRTPMNAIMGMAELLQETKLDEEQKRYVEIFGRAGQSLLNIINDILDLSKIEAGKFEIDQAPFSLSSVIEKSIEIVALKAHQKKLELVVDVEDNLHDCVIGDGNRLRQILVNLLGNAVKFTNRGEVLLKVSGRKIEDELRLTLEVQDTGIGMSETQIQNLFARFNQGDSSITKEFGGTGLGLSIVKRLTELMDGNIEVKSTQGIGSRFTLNFSLKTAPFEESTDDEVRIKGLRFLVVDDSRTNRLITKKILESQGAFVSEAINGKEALEFITSSHEKNEPYDLVILDCRMPELSGFDVATQVISQNLLSGSVLMMLTSDDRSGDLAKSRELGLKSYLVKPVLKKDLLQSISRALGGNSPVQNTKIEAEDSPEVGDLTILLVDDNDENRTVVKAFSKKQGWRIDEAKNGKEAIRLFESKDYDLILMDMQMPVLDGYSATKEIRKIENENGATSIPILALTAYALADEREKSFDSGCNGHLTKPITKKELIETVNTQARTRKALVPMELEDLIPDYIEGRKQEVIQLQSLLSQKDFSGLQKIGHKLRGSAGSYGFSELSEFGQEIEEGAMEKDERSVKSAILKIRIYLRNLVVEFTQYQDA